jgi:hypothetical protein
VYYFGVSYFRVWLPKQKKAVRLHRMAAATMLGRDLAPGEVVHHKDGNKQNNRFDNLEVLPSQRAHMVLEHLQRKQAQGIESLFTPDEILSRLE